MTARKRGKSQHIIAGEEDGQGGRGGGGFVIGLRIGGFGGGEWVQRRVG